MKDRHSFAGCGLKSLRTTCVVSIETVAPSYDSVLADCARSTAEFLHQETPDLISP